MNTLIKHHVCLRQSLGIASMADLHSLVFIFGNADFNEAVKAREDILQLFLLNLVRKIANIKADHRRLNNK